MSFRRPRFSRKFRLSAIGALLAGILAVVAFAATPSGATFDASQTGRVDVGTATLNLNLSDPYGNSGTFHMTFPNLKPNGDDATNDNAITRTFYVKNTGTIAATAKVGVPISNVNAGSGLTSADYAKLLVGVNGAALAPVTTMPSVVELGTVNPGQTIAVNVSVALLKAAGNEWQGKTLGADVTVTLTQS